MDWLNKLDNILDNNFFGSNDDDKDENVSLQEDHNKRPRIVEDNNMDDLDNRSTNGRDLDMEYLKENEDQLEEEYFLNQIKNNEANDSSSNIQHSLTENGEKMPKLGNGNSDFNSHIVAVTSSDNDNNVGISNVTLKLNDNESKLPFPQQSEQDQVVQGNGNNAITPIPDVKRIIPSGGRIQVMNPMMMRRTNAVTARRGNTPRRPGMILSVLRDDISDGSSSSDNDSSDQNDTSRDQIDTKNNIESEEENDHDNEIELNTDGYDHDTHRRPSIIVQNHDSNINDQVSPISSPIRFTQMISESDMQYDDDILLTQPSTLSSISSTPRKIPLNYSNNNDDNDTDNNNLSQRLPPLPIITQPIRAQSSTTVQIANVSHPLTPLANNNNNSDNSTLSNRKDDHDHGISNGSPSRTISIENSKNDNNVKVGDSNVLEMKEVLSQTKSARDIIEATSNSIVCPSSNNSVKTDIIQNTSTLSSDFDLEFKDDDYDEKDFDLDYFEQQQTTENDNDSNKVDNVNALHADEDNAKIAEVESKVEQDESETDSQLNEKKDVRILNVLQATMNDYLFSQGEADMSQDDDDYVGSDDEQDEDLDWEKNDYIIQPTIYTWDGSKFQVDDEDSGVSSPREPFNPTLNCHGVVRVKLLRVQHLPVGAGNSLEAIISLPPWKGRIRSEKVLSYTGPSMAGICARWDDSQEKNENESQDIHVDDALESFSQAEINKRSDQQSINSAGVPCHSMVHTYNNEDTPIPEILIELKGSTLQMFTRDICSFTLSCEPLMKSPGKFRRRWCIADENDEEQDNHHKIKSQKSDSHDHKTAIEENGMICPIILVEACFEPTVFGKEKAGINNPILATNPSLLSDQDCSAKTKEYDAEVRDRCETMESVESLTNKHSSTKPHLFRIYSEWRPTYCAICSSIIFRHGYRCEVCHLDCCNDCQLRVDIDLPCGSKAAKNVVESLSKSKLTVSKIYSIIAPVNESAEAKLVSEAEDSSNPESTLTAGTSAQTVVWGKGVGNFKLRIIKACLFQRPFPPEAELSYILKNSDRWLRRGDHYARVSWTDSKETLRTKAAFQTAKPRFDSEEMSITAMHYGTEFRIEILDASTDTSLGSSLVTTQGLLQWQRDKVASDGGLTMSAILSQKPIQTEIRKAVLELRTGVKSGFGLDFYKANKLGGSSRAGEITGWVEVEMSFEEDPEIHSNSKPKPCPERPNSDFNVELIQLHIARIFCLLEDFNELIGGYFYLVSWKNPALTSLSFIFFVTLCLRFNAEYYGSLPLAISIIYMLFLSLKRTKGYRAYLQRKERDASLKEMKGATVNYHGHRPTGTLRVSVIRGQHLTPQNGLGIPGSLVSTVIWDPIKYLDDKSRVKILECDPTSKAVYHIGETESSSVTFNPEWKKMHCSDQLQRLKQLLPNTNFISESNPHDTINSNGVFVEGKSEQSLEMPILQPMTALRQQSTVDIEEEEEEEGENVDEIELMPWDASHGAIVIQVRFTDVLSKLPIFDHVLGEVVIPFKNIVTNGIDSWFQVLPKGTLETIEDIPTDESKLESENADVKSFLTRLTDPDSLRDVDEEPDAETHMPRIYIKAQFTPPEDDITDIGRETSIVVAEHMIWSANTASKDSRGFIGSSLETFNTVRGVTGQVQYLQNQLGKILDIIEKLRNLFNFTCPEKSALVLLCVAVLWLLFALLPTRIVVLSAGLGQYGATLLAYISHKNKAHVELKDKMEAGKQESKDLSDEADGSYNPIVTRILNFFTSIPTNEDLRRYYFWEARKVGEREREIWAAKRRTGRLTKLYRAQWFSKLELKTPNNIAPGEDERSWDWISIFAIIQGHRFVWWRSENDFDNGENPLGQIFFAGHSGLAGLSPLELREFKRNEIDMVVNIFGRGSGGKGQLKISLLVEDKVKKESLETAVLNAIMNEKNE